MRLSKSACAPPPAPPGPPRRRGACRPVVPPAPAVPANWASTAGIDRAAARLLAVLVGGHHGHRRGHHAAAASPPLTLAMRVVVGPCQAHVRAAAEVRNRHHQVGHVVGYRVDLPGAHLLAGDLQHLVLDHVAQVQRLQDQVQGALEHHFVAEFDGDRRVRRDAFLLPGPADPGARSRPPTGPTGPSPCSAAWP